MLMLTARHVVASVMAVQMVASPALCWASDAGLDVARVAALTLPPDIAPTIIDGIMDEPLFPGALSTIATLFARPQVAAPGLCRRDSYTVTLNNQSRPAHWVGLAFGKDCSTLPQHQFAQLQPFHAPEKLAINALQNLKAAQRASRRRGSTLKFTCSEEAEPTGCAADPQRSMSALPFDQIFIVSKTGADKWVFTLRDPESSRFVWTVELTTSEQGSSHMHLRKLIPPPF